MAEFGEVAQGAFDAVGLEAAQMGVVGELIDVRADLAQLRQDPRGGLVILMNRRATAALSGL